MIHYGQESRGFPLLGRRKLRIACQLPEYLWANEQATGDVKAVNCERCLQAVNEFETGITHYGQFVDKQCRMLCDAAFNGHPLSLDMESINCEMCLQILAKVRERAIAWIMGNGFEMDYLHSDAMIEDMAIRHSNIMTWSTLTRKKILFYPDDPGSSAMHFGNSWEGESDDATLRYVTMLGEILRETFGKTNFTGKPLIDAVCGSVVMPTMGMATENPNAVTCRRCLRAVDEMRKRFVSESGS